jgi:methionyl-tRNA formyltransferase
LIWTYKDLDLYELDDPNVDYDVGISFMYQHRVSLPHLSKPWINFHPGPLPEYKGRNLCYHALINGEKEFGVSIHYMDEFFDTGKIIDVVKFPVGEDWCADSLSYFTLDISKTLFQLYLPKILSGKEFSTVENVGGTYYKKDVIDPVIKLSEEQERQIRAITYKEFTPRINISGMWFKVVRE